MEALRAGLRDLGYLEGKNIVIDFRWAEVVDRLRELASQASHAAQETPLILQDGLEEIVSKRLGSRHRSGRSPDWLKFKKLTVRKSGLHARHLYISARKRSGLGHAGKLAYPIKPLNVEGLDRPTRAHKEQGNHPAGVIVDVQFPCHSTPRPWWDPMPGTRRSFQCAEPAVDSTVGATCQFRSGYVRYAGKRGQSKRLPSFALRKILEARRLGYKSSACNGGARSGAGSRRIASIIPFLIAMVATSTRSWPMLKFRMSASSLSCPMAEAVGRGSSIVRRVPLHSKVI